MPNAHSLGIVSPPKFRQAMSDLHLWIGILAGWLLFTIFITGGISFYRDELSQWMRPEIPARPAHLEQSIVSTLALKSLDQLAPASPQWHIWLPTDRNNVVEVAWQTETDRERAWLDPMTGKSVHPRQTQAGEFFYYFHFSLHYLPRTLGRWIVGLCALFGLIAVVTGVIVHKRIFRDFFTFRWGKGQRSWLDAHNALSVFGLPFHLMILYTGLVTLMFMYMPWGKEAIFTGGNGSQELVEAMVVKASPPQAFSPNSTPIDIAPMFREASRHWSENETHRIIVSNPKTTASQVIITRGDRQRTSVSPEYLKFDGSDGSLIDNKRASSNASKTWGLMYALHLGRFGDGFARLLYFLLSLTGAAMVATGMVLWTVKRHQTQKNNVSTGLKFVEKGNIACISGILIAVPVFFIANRLLSTDLLHRDTWEINIFFILWVCASIHAWIRPAQRAWKEQFSVAASLFMILPIVNAVTTERGLLHSLSNQDWLFASFDGAFLLSGLALALMANRVRMPAA